MTNPGAHPLDPDTAIGQLRAITGDTASAPLTPPIDGQQSYAVWSDGALLGALLVAQENPYRAAASLYLALAAEYIQQGRSIRTEDLQLNTPQRGGDLREIADSFRELADDWDESESADIFFAAAAASPSPRRVEGSPYPFITL